MSYRRSAFRSDFENRIALVKKEVSKIEKISHRLPQLDLVNVRDMVFQCAVFQTSAAVESYLKLIVEAWAQSLKNNLKGDCLPQDTRAFFVRKRLHPHFKKFAFQEEEIQLHRSISLEEDLWGFLAKDKNLPHFFKGKFLHEACAYPSFKNIKKLFARIGITNVEAELNRVMRRDVETLIGAFQDIRTALAHSAPPQITFADVCSLITDQVRFISAVDRILYSHFCQHGGRICWT